MTLRNLLLDLNNLSDEQAEDYVFQEYARCYLDRGQAPRRIGVRLTHDGTPLRFTESRFQHAFRKSTHGRFSKDVFDRSRGERVAWIGVIASGRIDGVECWMVPPKEEWRYRSRRTRNRMYLLRDEQYVVWLEPGKDGGWWFSTAYLAGYGDVRRYCKAGYKLWEKKIPRD